jgi:hypothetical protein
MFWMMIGPAIVRLVFSQHRGEPEELSDHHADTRQ